MTSSSMGDKARLNSRSQGRRVPGLESALSAQNDEVTGCLKAVLSGARCWCQVNAGKVRRRHWMGCEKYLAFTLQAHARAKGGADCWH